MEREAGDEECTAFKTREGSAGGATIWVGTSAGRIARSDVEGEGFTTVREVDRDARAINGFVEAGGEGEEALWALTAGEGALYAPGRGERFIKSNDGLLAASPTALTQRAGALVLGADSGLYQGFDDPGASVTWSALLERAVTATTTTPDRLIVGTRGGALISAPRSSGEQSVQELDTPSAQERGAGALTLPERRRGAALKPYSIVSIEAGGVGERVWARTFNRGSWVSEDGGEMWRLETSDERLIEALSGERIMQWLVPRGAAARYVISRDSQESGRIRLWRSGALEEPWRNVATFGEELIGRMPPHFVARGEEEVIKVSAEGVEASRDGGASWRALEVSTGEQILAVSQSGPWLIALYREAGAVHAIKLGVVRGERGLELEAVERRRLELSRSRFEPKDVQQMEWMDTRLFFRTSSGLWAASLIARAPRQSRGTGMLLTLLASVILGSLAFILVHGYGRR